MKYLEPRLEKLKRMQQEAIHRYTLADANYKRAKDRVERAGEDVNVLAGIIREEQGKSKEKE